MDTVGLTADFITHVDDYLHYHEMGCFWIRNEADAGGSIDRELAYARDQEWDAKKLLTDVGTRLGNTLAANPSEQTRTAARDVFALLHHASESKREGGPRAVKTLWRGLKPELLLMAATPAAAPAAVSDDTQHATTERGEEDASNLSAYLAGHPDATEEQALAAVNAKIPAGHRQRSITWLRRHPVWKDNLERRFWLYVEGTPDAGPELIGKNLGGYSKSTVCGWTWYTKWMETKPAKTKKVRKPQAIPLSGRTAVVEKITAIKYESDKREEGDIDIFKDRETLIHFLTTYYEPRDTSDDEGHEHSESLERLKRLRVSGQEKLYGYLKEAHGFDARPHDGLLDSVAYAASGWLESRDESR